MIDFRILGPLEVIRDGEPVDLGAGSQQALLAVLLLAPNQRISTTGLIDALWYEPPASAAKIVQNGVMRLRRLLLPDSLLTRNQGYVLQVAPGSLDLDRFSVSLKLGREALRREDFSAALELLDRAIAEWRGAPLRELGDLPFVEEESRRLDNLWLDAVADRFDAAIALGRHAELTGELEQLVGEHPLHERVRAQLMLALYRSGRQTESLNVYRDGRRILVEEIGVEPGPALRELEQQILRQDPALDPPLRVPTAIRRPTTRIRRFSILLAAVAVVVSAAAAVGFFRSRGAPAITITPNSVAVVDADNGRLTTDIGVGVAPSGIAFAFGSAWVLNQQEGTVTRIDRRSGRVTHRAIPVGINARARVSSIAVADGRVWTLDSGSGVVTWVASAGGSTQFALSSRYHYASDYLTLAGGEGRLWVTSNHFSALLEVDPRRGRVIGAVRLPGRPLAAVGGRDGIWCITSRGAGAGLLVRVDPATRTVVARTPIPGTPTAVAAGLGAVWVAVAKRNLVYKIDEQSNAVVRTIPAPGGPIGVAVGADRVWVLTGTDPGLLGVNPTSGAIVTRTALDGTPHAVAVADRRVWVALS